MRTVFSNNSEVAPTYGHKEHLEWTELKAEIYFLRVVEFILMDVTYLLGEFISNKNNELR